MRYPFKFLDSYTQNDQEIFFGRTAEIDGLYKMMFEASVVVVYGASGTGKTSLINCGLAGKFQPHDWFPLMIRRGVDINASLETELNKAKGKRANSDIYSKWINNSGDGVGDGLLSPVCTAIRDIYQKYFRPVCLIFDQFEELFILGNSNEEKIFIQSIKDIIQSNLPVKIIFSIREEYLGYLYEFERVVPQLMRKTLRVEPMNFEKVKEVVNGVANYEDSIVKVKSSEVDEIAKGVFDKIKGKGKTLTIQLPFLQVFFHKFYMNITGDEEHNTEAEFTVQSLSQMEEIDNVLVDFLEEQVERITKKLGVTYTSLNSELTWKILSPFSTLEGTKDPISLKELYCRLPEVDKMIVNDVVKLFMECRILRQGSNMGDTELEQVLELAHDSLAKPIADKRSVDETAVLQVKRLIVSQTAVNPEAREPFTEKQLLYIDTRIDKLQLNDEEKALIQKSRDIIKEQKEAERKSAETKLIEQKIRMEEQDRQYSRIRKYFAVAVVVALIAFAAGTAAFLFYESSSKQRVIALNEKQNAIRNAEEAKKQQAIAETERSAALRSRKHADSLKVQAEQSALQAEAEKRNALRSANVARLHSDIADREKMVAQYNERRADTMKMAAETSALEAERAKSKALESAAEAEKQKKLAEDNFQNFIELKKTVIGTRYQGGVVISWKDSTGKHGVIAGEKDLGRYNWEDAKKVCQELVLNGFDDWRLPTRTELAVLFANKNLVGGFTLLTYWADGGAGSLGLNAWSVLFTTGYIKGRRKGNLYLVRPVRDF